MKCRVLRTLAHYDSAIKDALAWIAWAIVYSAVLYMMFKAW